jgi:hypothetical protein
MYGYEDKFLNNMSSMSLPPVRPPPPVLTTRCSTLSMANVVESQPWPDQDPPRPCASPSLVPLATPTDVLLISLSQVMDVAQALSHLVGMPAIDRTLALPGPSTHTHEFLLELISTLTYNAPSRAPAVPKRVALALASAAQRIWWPTLSPDEVERRYIDDVDTPGDWAAVGVEPDEIENHAITYVRRYRSACVIIIIPSLRPAPGVPPSFFFSHFVINSANYIRPIVLPPRPVSARFLP